MASRLARIYYQKSFQFRIFFLVQIKISKTRSVMFFAGEPIPTTAGKANNVVMVKVVSYLMSDATYGLTMKTSTSYEKPLSVYSVHKHYRSETVNKYSQMIYESWHLIASLAGVTFIGTFTSASGSSDENGGNRVKDLILLRLIQCTLTPTLYCHTVFCSHIYISYLRVG